MEGCALQSPIITIVSSYIPRTPSRFQTIKFPNAYRYPNAQKKFRCFSVGAQASGATKSSSGTTEAITKKVDMKDENLAFVAGATGKVGSRLVRELLKLGFRVRAGVRSAERAQTLVQNVRQMKIDTENTNEGIQPVEKLEIVECDLEKRDQIGKALGNASVVLCCIGASEKEVFDITGPYRIDYLATKNLIEAATVAKVNHFILLTSLGTNKVGFPAAILNLFWGVLIWKRKAEEALIASGVPYTIVRPGGMERPTDAYKETHNITLSLEDTLFGGQVSNLQVAELMASMAKNRGLSYCKVVEVIAETTAPLKPMEELLKKIPSQRSAFYSVEEPSSEKRLDSIPSKEPSTSYEDLKAPISPTTTTSTSPAASKASETGAMPASSTSTSLQEISGTVAEGEGQQTEVKKERPLSPYPFYENLKPPTSPSPTAPGIQGDSSNADATSELTSDVQSASIGPATDVTNTTAMPHQVSMERPLSPYVVYEDLKPPSSPTPKPSGPVDMASVYDKVKPPAFPSSDTPIVPPFSPSPNDSGPEMSTGIVNSTGKDQTDDEPIGNEEYHSKPKPKPLSPFTMYEDLKPPASPSPPRRY